MKPFIYSILFLFSLNATFSQTKEVIFKKSFIIDENTILDIDTKHVSIVFEESKDNKIHFDYSISFNKASKVFMKKILKGINCNVVKINNKVKLSVKNTTPLGKVNYINVDSRNFKEFFGAFFEEYFRKKRQNDYPYKTKDSVLNEINFSIGSNISDYTKKLIIKYPEKNLGRRVRKFKQFFIVKVPKNTRIKVNSSNSRFNFKFDLNNIFEANSKISFYKFKKLNNNRNNIKLTNGIFQASEMYGGHLELKDVYKSRIGIIKNLKLQSEISKIQIGEISENVSFTDFNSKLYLYNFNSNFSNFNLTGDYSEVNFYKVKEQNYAMNVFGFNTALNLDNNKTTFGDSKDKKLIKILEKKPKNNSLNKIDIELKNGILNIK